MKCSNAPCSRHVGDDDFGIAGSEGPHRDADGNPICWPCRSAYMLGRRDQAKARLRDPVVTARLQEATRLQREHEEAMRVVEDASFPREEALSGGKVYWLWGRLHGGRVAHRLRQLSADEYAIWHGGPVKHRLDFRSLRWRLRDGDCPWSLCMRCRDKYVAEREAKQ